MEKPSSNPHRRLGFGLLAASWVALLGLLSVGFNDWFEYQANPNRGVEHRIGEGGQAELSLHRNRAGHYLMSGRINGEPVTFLIDTGATTTSVPEHLAERLRLSRGQPYPVSTANGRITVYDTRLESLEFGGLQIGKVRAHLNPFMDTDEILLGMNVLKDLELVQRGGQLTIRVPR